MIRKKPNPEPSRIQINTIGTTIRSQPRFAGVGGGERTGGAISDDGDEVVPDVFEDTGGRGVFSGVCAGWFTGLFACAFNCTPEFGKINGSLLASALTVGVSDRADCVTTVSASKDIGVCITGVANGELVVTLVGDAGVWCGATSWVASIEEMACLKSSGTGRLNASAIVAVKAEALEKRSWGFLARLLRRTCESAGGRFGLTRCGSVGVSMRCCSMILVTVSPRNGGTPVNIS